MSAIRTGKVDDISEMSHTCHFTLATHWHFDMIQSSLTLLPLMINNDDDGLDLGNDAVNEHHIH